MNRPVLQRIWYISCDFLHGERKSTRNSSEDSRGPRPVTESKLLYQFQLRTTSTTFCNRHNTPLWQIFHPSGTLEDQVERKALVKDITSMWTDAGLPAFYVVTNFIRLPDQAIFIRLPDQAIFIGVREQSADVPFIRVVITHIALRLPKKDVVYNRTTSRIDKVLKPYVRGKGWDWESTSLRQRGSFRRSMD